MIEVKDRPGPIDQESRFGGGDLLKTYTLYLRTRRGERKGFEHAMVESTTVLVDRALDLLEERPDVEAVDVCFGETELFQVTRPGSEGDAAAGRAARRDLTESKIGPK